MHRFEFEISARSIFLLRARSELLRSAPIPSALMAALVLLLTLYAAPVSSAELSAVDGGLSVSHADSILPQANSTYEIVVGSHTFASPAQAGDQFTVPVALQVLGSVDESSNALAQIGALHLSLAYDINQFEAVECQTSDSPGVIECGLNEPGLIYLAVITLDGIEAGALANVTLRVLPPKAATAIIMPTIEELLDGEGTQLSASLQPSSIVLDPTADGIGNPPTGGVQAGPTYLPIIQYPIQ